MNYNLIDETWIPCLTKDGTTRHLSLRCALTDSKGILEIIDQSPLVIASLHRFLLAILERSMQILDYARIKEIWRDGSWNLEMIEAYLDRWHSRFDLFDEKRPFYQSPDFCRGKPITIGKLFNEMSTANNTVLFDRRFDDDGRAIDAPEVARALITAQCYSLGGGKSATVNFLHAPLVGKAMILLKGGNLFETLTLNLLPMSSSNPTNLTGQASPEQLRADRPAWEAEEPDVAGEERHILGYLDLLTWQSRVVNLMPSEDGHKAVINMYFAQGVYTDDQVFDPMVAYRKLEDYGWRPIGLDLNREPWRSYAALIHTTAENRRSMNINNAGALVLDGLISRNSLYRLEIFGLCSEQAKIHQWRQTQVPLSASCIEDEVQFAYLADALKLAEDCQKALRKGLRGFAYHMLAPDPSRAPDKAMVNQLVDSYHAIPRYWSVLEVPFLTLVMDMADSRTKQLARENKLLLAWSEITLRKACTDTFEDTARDVAVDARGMRATVKARGIFNIELAKILNEARGRYNV